MDFLSPATWADALAAKAEHPDAVPIAGGTDVMVEMNFDRRRPPALLDLTRIPDLAEHGTENGTVRLGGRTARLPELASATSFAASPTFLAVVPPRTHWILVVAPDPGAS